MAEYEARARETAAEMACPEPEPYVERFRKRAMGQEDVRTAQARTRGEQRTAERVPAWRYHYRGTLAPPTFEADRAVSFEELHPEPIGPSDGLPTALSHDLIQFNDQEIACARSGEGPAVATTMRVAGSNAELLGREVDALFQWIEAQRALATSIESIAPVMTALRDNGILDADFAIVDEAHLDGLLDDVGRSGRVEAYPSEDVDQSVQALQAAGKVADSDAELMNDQASIRRFEAMTASVQASLRGAEAGVDAYYARRMQQAEEREVAALVREKADTIAALDVFNLPGILGGMANGTVNSARLTGPAAVVTGALDLVMLVGKLAAHEHYEALITQGHARITRLRERAEGFESTEMMAGLDALLKKAGMYVRLIQDLRTIAEQRRASRTQAFSGFGAVAADAVQGMRRDRAPAPDDPFHTGDRRAHGRVQRLFANIPLYELVGALSQGARWPRLLGKIPMSGYLAGIDDPRGLPQFAEEAAKLRWWKDKADEIGALHKRTRGAIGAIGTRARSTQ